jgi:hypothetical protein
LSATNKIESQVLAHVLVLIFDISSGEKNFAIDHLTSSVSKSRYARPLAQDFLTSSVISSASFLVSILSGITIALIVHQLDTVSLKTEKPESAKSFVISINCIPNLRSGLSLP